MKSLSFLLFSVLFIFIQCQPSDTAQKAGPKKGPDNNWVKNLEKENLEADYKGIYTREGVRNDLFPIRKTGISTTSIKEAAEVFLNSLTSAQKEKTTFDIEDDEWQKWANVDNGLYPRAGISIKEMNQEQRKNAFALLQEALSKKGLQLSKDIMKTDQTLREINQDNPIFDEDLYYFTIMGTPSEDAPWGWQLEGHHLAINYFILGDQVVMTPTFMGGEPIITTSGKYKGNTLFQDEQNLGLKLMQSFSEEQQKLATLSMSKDHNNIEAEAFSDSKEINFQGLKVTDMTTDQQGQLIRLIDQYVSNIREGHAQVKMEEVKAHFEDTYFAWRGKTDDQAVFYYRIHSPVVLIEFDHQAPIGIRGERKPTRNHIHTIVRTPNGNDYGKDYLRQHLESHHSH